ncbi:hypothetical protein I308_100909 [Cryptococcus tetragattii IND107]|uniref:Uncharacterized protein n=1 Tax=Cryptococcus tetragattii IND107 TaxID=1296105 RepID=A0ABR3C184_9TREE
MYFILRDGVLQIVSTVFEAKDCTRIRSCPRVDRGLGTLNVVMSPPSQFPLVVICHRPCNGILSDVLHIG